MVRTSKFILFILSLLFLMPMYSRNKLPLGHFLTVDASLGYSTILENYQDLETGGTIGGFFGINYELRKKSFLFTTGIEGQMLTANSLFKMDNFEVPIYDTQGKLATMHYQIGTIDERTQLFYASIPIMFGYHGYGFYIGGGAKIGFPLVPIVKSQYTYTTSATYTEYIEDFVNMNNHHYGTYDRLSNYKMKVPIKYSVVMEIDYNVLDRSNKYIADPRHGLRISAVCEYGLNNLGSTPTDGTLYEINPTNATELTILPYYMSHSTQGQHINHFYAGLKITWVFRSSKGDCKCD